MEFACFTFYIRIIIIIIILQKKPLLRPFWRSMKSLPARLPLTWNAPKSSVETWLNMQTWRNKDSSTYLDFPSVIIILENEIRLTWHAISRDVLDEFLFWFSFFLIWAEINVIFWLWLHAPKRLSRPIWSNYWHQLLRLFRASNLSEKRIAHRRCSTIWAPSAKASPHWDGSLWPPLLGPTSKKWTMPANSTLIESWKTGKTSRVLSFSYQLYWKQ